MPPRIPQPTDFAPLQPHLHTTLIYPPVPELTTSILLLFHGLGDSEASFAAFARALRLPHVLAIAVRGVAAISPLLLGDGDGDGDGEPGFHWGDDILPKGEGLDPDPGFGRAQHLVLRRLVDEVLLARCGWDLADVLLFGFGQGGSLALGLASRLRERRPGTAEAGDARFKGVVTVGGPLPDSMVPSAAAVRGRKAGTPVLACHGRDSELLDEGAVEGLREQFGRVDEVVWERGGDGMPRDREEMRSVMRFLGERLGEGGF